MLRFQIDVNNKLCSSRVFILTLHFILLFCKMNAQQNIEYNLNFSAIYDSSKIKESTYFKCLTNDSLKMEVFKFYISDIKFLHDDQIIFQENNSYHLVDIFLHPNFSIPLPAKNQYLINKIHFNFGIDSTTNVSGALSGSLDPTNGMYWTWQNGYINCKLEGNCNLCTSKNNAFEFHLGGYQSPYASLQVIELKVNQSVSQNIMLNLNAIFSNIDLSKEDHVMSPGPAAKKLSQLVAKSFFIRN